MNLEFTYYSINCLTALEIIGFLVAAFIYRRTAISWLLVGFFGGLLVTFSYLFFIYCSLDRGSPLFEYIHFAGLSISSICLLQIPYKLSSHNRKRESRLILILSIFAHLYVLIYVSRFIEKEPTVNFESHLISYAIEHIERINIVFIVDYLLAVVLFLRNALTFADKSDDSSQLRGAGTSAKNRFYQFWFWIKNRVNWETNEAIVNRNSALLLTCCVFVWLILSTANFGYTGYSSFSWAMNAGILVMLLFFVITYINRFEKKSKLMTKLLAICFVFIIVIISNIGYITLFQKEQAFDRQKRMEINFLKQSISAKTFDYLPPDLVFVFSGPIDNNPHNSQAYELMFSRSPEFKVSDVLAEEKMIRDSLGGFSSDVPLKKHLERWKTYTWDLARGNFQGRGQYSYLGRKAASSSRYVLFDFIQAGRIFRVGYRYDTYRAIINETAEVFVWVLLLASALVIVGFPILFRINMIKPVQALLIGVKRLNAGDLDVSVPVTYDDEVGFLTRSFNNMARAIQDHTLLLEQKVAERTREIERLNDLKTRFLAIVAHDLRSPLKTIEFSVGEITEEMRSVTEHQRHVEAIQKTVAYMFRLLEDLSDLAMIEAGKTSLEYTENDYTEFVAQNLEIKHQRAQKKGIHLTLQASDDIPRLYFDRTKMNQVLDNLLENAIAHSDNCTEILVVIEKGEKAVITRVVDRGRGIAEDEMSSIFDEYHTNQNRSGQRSKSRGLGLAIVKKLVQEHRGEISVESQIGSQTTFSFTLPIYEE